ASSGTWDGCTTPSTTSPRTRCTGGTTTTSSPSGCCTHSPKTSSCRSATTRSYTARDRSSARCRGTNGSGGPPSGPCTQGRGRARIGLPVAGEWRAALNTDGLELGGGGVGNGGRVWAGDTSWHGLTFSADLTLPPLAVLWLVPST